MNGYQETVDLLNDTIDIIPQSECTNIKAPCTGFCYLVIPHIDSIVKYYLNKKVHDYKAIIRGLIINAGKRKQEKKDISEEGEYINESTILNDFPNICNKMEYLEMNTVDRNSLSYTKNTLYIILIEMNYKDYMIVTRSHETFIIIKIDTDKYLIVDSHKNKNGYCNILDTIRYITKYDKYKDLIQIGKLK
jgi:hypothetical protein